MTVKLVVVAAMIVGFVLARRMHIARMHRIAADADPVPRLPVKLFKGSERTWVVFTTRFCAQCGPVERLLRAAEPDSRVVLVDAEREPHLARSFRVATAPTVLLADRDGHVLQRLVGAPAVKQFVGTPN